jgi:hypothetical protein
MCRDHRFASIVVALFAAFAQSATAALGDNNDSLCSRNHYILMAPGLCDAVPGAIRPGQFGPSFRITQLYSNIDGSSQYVRLTEVAGLSHQHKLKGLKLVAIHDGTVKE